MKTFRSITAWALTLCLIFIFTVRAKAQDESAVVKEKKGYTQINMGNMKIEQYGDDTTIVFIKKDHGHDDHGGCGTNFSTFPWGCKKGKFNGHWAGIDFGWNGYVNSDFNMDFPESERYLDMNVARSLMVNLNPFELNLNIAANKFGLVSGLGFQLSNFYFTHNYTLNADGNSLAAYELFDGPGLDARSVPMDINKLYVSYLTLPVIFEFQTNAKHRMNSFHISAGVIGGLKMCSWQKQKLTSYDQTLYLKYADGTIYGTINPTDQKVKYKDSFYLNPFKLDATARIGWSYINLFATYSITSLFQTNKGPEIYPFTVGITLLGW